MALSITIGLPIQALYHATNGLVDKTLDVLVKLFSPDANKEHLTILWSRMGPSQRPMWIPNHFVHVFRHDTTYGFREDSLHFRNNTGACVYDLFLIP
ncbi:hypothetical protein ACJMK2_024827 [Sinanodonta woodiana]|uniref:Uncharacterized protein n=1 Tax=Sinanodonta woodiana TaxID=1069815 RepID=A0ABD3XG48_SINWO